MLCLKINLAIGKGSWPEELHILSFYPRGGELIQTYRAYFHATGSGFRDTGRFSKLPIFGHETWPLAKVPDVAHITLYAYGV